MVVTYDTMRVLREFLTQGDPLCGAEITRSLKILSGTLYPMLARLKQEGWIKHEASLPAPDQPTAHFYKLTSAGRAAFLDRLCRLTIPDNLWRDMPEHLNSRRGQ